MPSRWRVTLPGIDPASVRLEHPARGGLRVARRQRRDAPGPGQAVLRIAAHRRRRHRHRDRSARHVRAYQPNTSPEANYQPKIKTPEWEAVVHGPGTSFPLGVLGLPVVYKGGYTVDAVDHRGRPARRASALWLRPVGEGTTWRLLSFAFTNGFLPGPNAPTVKLRKPSGTRKPLHIATADVDYVTRTWIDVHATGGSFTEQGTHR
jgi:hypothetical protein